MPDASQIPGRPTSVAIISKPGRPELSDILPQLYQWLIDRGYKVVMDTESAAYFPTSDVLPAH